MVAFFEKWELLRQEAPHVVILGDPLAVLAGLVEGMEVVGGQELQRFLQGEPLDLLEE